jgi:hypothetical protein
MPPGITHTHMLAYHKYYIWVCLSNMSLVSYKDALLLEAFMWILELSGLFESMGSNWHRSGHMRSASLFCAAHKSIFLFPKMTAFLLFNKGRPMFSKQNFTKITY